MTNYSRSVLKSNGLRRQKIRLKKFGFSSKTVPANIVQKVTVTTLFQIAFHPDFQLLAQTAHVRFRSRKRVHYSAFGEKSHTRAHTAKQVVFWVGGWYHYPRSVLHGSETLRGRVSERRTLPLLGLGRVCSRRTQRAFGTAMRLCASLFRGVAAPLGCVILVRMLIALLGGPVANVPSLWYDKFNKLESVMH